MHSKKHWIHRHSGSPLYTYAADFTTPAILVVIAIFVLVYYSHHFRVYTALVSVYRALSSIHSHQHLSSCHICHPHYSRRCWHIYYCRHFGREYYSRRFWRECSSRCSQRYRRRVCGMCRVFQRFQRLRRAVYYNVPCAKCDALSLLVHV